MGQAGRELCVRSHVLLVVTGTTAPSPVSQVVRRTHTPMSWTQPIWRKIDFVKRESHLKNQKKLSDPSRKLSTFELITLVMLD